MYLNNVFVKDDCMHVPEACLRSIKPIPRIDAISVKDKICQCSMDVHQYHYLLSGWNLTNYWIPWHRTLYLIYV